MIRILLLNLILFSSCKNSKQLSLVNVLKSECFWDRTGDNQVIGGLNSCYRFLPNGKCYFYYYNFYNKRITDSVYKYDDGDNILPDTWSVVGDTLLIATGAHYRVLNFCKDSVVVGLRYDTITFIKN
jgi:hypothetical protein